MKNIDGNMTKNISAYIDFNKTFKNMLLDIIDKKLDASPYGALIPKEYRELVAENILYDINDTNISVSNLSFYGYMANYLNDKTKQSLKKIK